MRLPILVVAAIVMAVVLWLLVRVGFGPLDAKPARYAVSDVPSVVLRIDHVTDGDTVVLRNGQRVRIVQIDTPEVFFGTECYGPQASATTKRLLPPGTRVRLLVERATDRVDDFGRLLRYVVRVDGLNVNLRLVGLGAAAPWFYEGRRGRYAARLDVLARGARRARRGLWRACPRTVYDPYRAIETRR